MKSPKTSLHQKQALSKRRLSRTKCLAQIQTLGTKETNLSATILNDSYKLNRWSVEVRLHAERTLNGSNCPIDSAGVFVKAVKAVDP